MKESKTFTVWIEIEEYDPETDTYEGCDVPGAGLAVFDNYDDAVELTRKIYDNFGVM